MSQQALLSREDCDLITEILPPQLEIELVRSHSIALVSDAMRAFTVAHAANRLSKDGYTYMIGALAEVLGSVQ